MSVPENPEAFAFAVLIASALQRAGWSAEFPHVMSSADFTDSWREMIAKYPNLAGALPTFSLAGGGTVGIAIVAHSIQPEDMESLNDLRQAFAAGGVFVQGVSRDGSLPKDTIRIVVGPK